MFTVVYGLCASPCPPLGLPGLDYQVPLDKDSGDLQDGGDTAAATIPLGPEFTFLEGTFNSNIIEVM